MSCSRSTGEEGPSPDKPWDNTARTSAGRGPWTAQAAGAQHPRRECQRLSGGLPRSKYKCSDAQMRGDILKQCPRLFFFFFSRTYRQVKNKNPFSSNAPELNPRGLSAAVPPPPPLTWFSQKHIPQVEVVELTQPSLKDKPDGLRSAPRAPEAVAPTALPAVVMNRDLTVEGSTC